MAVSDNKCTDTHCHAQDESACCCGKEQRRGGKFPWDLLVAAAFTLTSLLPVYPDSLEPWLKLGLCAAAVLLAGTPVFISAGKALWARHFDENILMGLAAVAAFAIGDFAEGAAVVLFFRLGEMLETAAENKSRRSIAALAEIRPDTAVLESGEALPARDVPVGSIIIIAPHTRVPLDCIVLEGSSSLDCSALTGESLPRDAATGTQLLSGMVNGAGLLKARTTAAFGDSAASRILKMVEDAQARKSRTQKLIARFARVYTPAVMLGAALLFAVGSLFFGGWRLWLPKALAFLVSSCPCALVLSVPLAYFAGMGAAAKRGIIIKGGTFLDSLAKAESFAFDKTGTLTSGRLELKKTLTLDGLDEQRALELAAVCEHYSEHPLALAIKYACGGTQAPENARELTSGGTVCDFGGRRLICGNKRLLAQCGVELDSLPDAPVYLAVDGKAVAAFLFEQSLRKGAMGLPQRLRGMGVKRVALLTGDAKAQADEIAQRLGIDEIHAGLLPQDKLSLVEKMDGGTVFVGDGVNDAPVLAAADAGVALGLGSQAACESADIIIAGEDISALAECRRLCRRVRGIVTENIVFSLAVKAAVLLWAVFGDAPIAAAVFADVGVLALTVLNAGRLLHSRRGK
ncbi:MAG: cadmium-translocating P-type ATPase [Clostridium sp.]|jgi:Cd2+/Zn2+-exporting ATPase|nr:cadmium-translocating P-type ATPase [Clostridium sp.]